MSQASLDGREPSLIALHLKLFDGLIQALDRHRDEIKEDMAETLKAARVNYLQDSAHYLVNCLVLAAHELGTPGEDLARELKLIIDQTYEEINENLITRHRVLAEKIAKRARQTREEILEDIRRGED